MNKQINQYIYIYIFIYICIHTYIGQRWPILLHRLRSASARKRALRRPNCLGLKELGFRVQGLGFRA